MKKLVAFILALSVLGSVGSAFATTEEKNIAPSTILRYEEQTKISPTLTVSKTSAAYRLTVRADASITKITSVLQIQKENGNGTYSNYGLPWSVSTDSNILVTNGEKPVTSGGTYRLKVTVTLHVGSTKGTPITAYST